MRIVIFVFIFGMLYSVSFAQSAQQYIFCHYGGALAMQILEYNYTFSIDDVPERCDVIIYGGTNFNSQPAEEDLEAIKELKNAGKTVYMLYKSPDDVNWTSIISSTDPAVLDDFIAPMLTYLSKGEIDGVNLGYLGLLENIIPGYDIKISEFLCKIKKQAPNLKISILVYSYKPEFYAYSDVFDFAVINSLVDIYFIDTVLINKCGKNTTAANGGRLPTTSNGTDDTRYTLEIIQTNVFNSGMDKNKLYISLNDGATWLEPNGTNFVLPYYDYCTGPVDESKIYCTDTMQQFYDAAQYAKKYFKGMLIDAISTDDWGDSCGCGKFPVANTYIDGWKNQPPKSCDKFA